MKKQFVYDIFTPKQNLPELKPLHSRLHKLIIQMQKKVDSLFSGFTHNVHRNTCPHIRCSFDTLPLLNILNLSIINKNMRTHTQLTKNIKY